MTIGKQRARKRAMLTGAFAVLQNTVMRKKRRNHQVINNQGKGSFFHLCKSSFFHTERKLVFKKMSFIVSLVMGLSVGIGLMVAYTHYQHLRSKRRLDLATKIAALARMTVRDSRKLLPPEFYPSWVVFSQRQKLLWLNLHFEKIWPYVNEASSELIKSYVEPILEQYRPAVLSSLKFSKLTLGTVAPQFTGVSIIEDESGDKGITVELEMQWDGNPNIVIDVRTRVGVGLPIQVKNIGFAGVFRLIFKPLVEEFPGFQAVSYSLREKTNLDFTLNIVGDALSSIPGVSDLIEDTIRDAIEDSIMWPVRQIVPILPGDYSDLELKPTGTLEVKLVQAKNLTNKSIIGKSDPYAVLFVRPLRDKMKTSKTMNHQLNPIWNEHFDFVVEDALTQHLTVRIFDDEGLLPSELIGCARVALNELEPGKVKDVWLKLFKSLDVQRDTKNRGQVHLELMYCPYGMESSLKNPINPDVSSTTLEECLQNADGSVSENLVSEKASPKMRDVIVKGVLSGLVCLGLVKDHET